MPYALLRKAVADFFSRTRELEVKPEDVVSVAEKSRGQLRIQAAIQLSSQRAAVEWVDVDAEKLEGVFKRLPDREELPSEINENLIVELYSK